MCHTTLMQNSHLVTLFDLTLALTLVFTCQGQPLPRLRSIVICYLLHHPGSPLAKFGLAAVISSVSGADKAKSNDFYLRPDLELTCDLKIFLIS